MTKNERKKLEEYIWADEKKKYEQLKDDLLKCLNEQVKEDKDDKHRQ